MKNTSLERYYYKNRRYHETSSLVTNKTYGEEVHITLFHYNRLRTMYLNDIKNDVKYNDTKALTTDTHKYNETCEMYKYYKSIANEIDNTR